jgi:type II secretory pathway pseudopilin PulG
MKLLKNEQSGRSMVEILGVLAIIGVLSVGGIAGYSKAMNKFKINKTSDQISMLIANIRTIYSTQGDYKGLNNKMAISYGIVPNDMIKTITSGSSTTQSLNNVFGGNVDITTSNMYQATSNDTFVITYSGISAEACVALATADWGNNLIALGASGSANAAKSAASRVFLGRPQPGSSTVGNAQAVPGGTTVSTPMPVTIAVNACNCGGTHCEVSWKLY